MLITLKDLPVGLSNSLTGLKDLPTGSFLFLIELFCKNPVVSVLLSVMFCAKIGIRYRKKPRIRKPVDTMKRFFNNNLTTLSYNRIA